MTLRPSRRCSTQDALVYLPPPPKHYLISKPLRIYSNQTLQLDRFTVIRLKDGSDCLMITNDDHERGNENIALVGGVWDMHNEGQSLTEYQKTRIWKGTYDPARYLGMLMRFNRVKRLTLRGLTLKDPVTCSMQLGNLYEFTIEDITFDTISNGRTWAAFRWKAIASTVASPISRARPVTTWWRSMRTMAAPGR